MRRRAPKVYKRDDSPYFYLSYYDRSGRLIRRSSGCTRRSQAMQALKRAEAEMRLVISNRLVVDAFDQLLSSRRLAPSTTTSYRLSKNRWLSFLKNEGVNDVKGLTCDLADKYVEHRRVAGASDTTIGHDLRFLSTVWTFLQEYPSWKEHLPANPVRRSTRRDLKKQQPRERWASNDELDAILAACCTAMERAIVIVAAETGLHSQELAKLTWDDVDLPKRQITLAVTPRVAWGLSPSFIPIAEACFTALNFTPRHSTSLNVFWRGDGLPFVNFSAVWRQIAKRSDISNVRFSDLRRTFMVRVVRQSGFSALYRLLSNPSARELDWSGQLFPEKRLEALHEALKTFKAPQLGS